MINVFLILFFTSFSIPLFSQTILNCSKSGDDVSLQWTGGSPNYTITYSTTPTFQSGNVTLNDSNSGTQQIHFQALKKETNYFYDVSGADEINRAISLGGYLPPAEPFLEEILR